VCRLPLSAAAGDLWRERYSVAEKIQSSKPSDTAVLRVWRHTAQAGGVAVDWRYDSFYDHSVSFLPQYPLRLAFRLSTVAAYGGGLNADYDWLCGNTAAVSGGGWHGLCIWCLRPSNEWRTQ